MFHVMSKSHQLLCPGIAYAFAVIRASCPNVCLSSISGPQTVTFSHSTGSLCCMCSERSRACCTRSGSRGRQTVVGRAERTIDVAEASEVESYLVVSGDVTANND